MACVFRVNYLRLYSMVMKFTNKGSSCTIQGLLPGKVELISKKEATKCFSILESKTDPCAVVIVTEQQLTVTTSSRKEQPEELELLMEEFNYLFQVPTELPQVGYKVTGFHLKMKGLWLKSDHIDTLWFKKIS